MSALKVLAIGASQNTGFFAALRLLESGATVTFLLRNPAAFDNNEEVLNFVESGKARLVKGDATNIDDVRKAWAEAGKGEREGEVDFLLFTLGGTTAHFHILKGLVITPPNVCTLAFLTVLRALPPALRVPGKQPKIIAQSNAGTTNASYSWVPIPLKPFFAYLLRGISKDKAGLEIIAAYVSGWEWVDKDSAAELIGAGWRELDGLPAAGSLTDVAIIRAPILTDGRFKGQYRVSPGDKEGGHWTISRHDMAHFLAEGVVKHWDSYKGLYTSVAY